jgi:RNA polymerase sigma-70 factor, ECF subfamily
MEQQQEEEARWVAATLAGDQQSYSRLVDRYSGAVFSLAYRMLGNAQDAEDATQEIFFKAYTRLESYDRARKFSTWLLTVASNYCIDRIRRRRFAWVTLDDVAFTLPSAGAGPERSYLERERREQVQGAIQALPEGYRLVAVLRYWNDLSYSEIAEVTGLTEATVKTRLHRARKMLANLLDPEGVAAETSSA